MTAVRFDTALARVLYFFCAARHQRMFDNASVDIPWNNGGRIDHGQ